MTWKLSQYRAGDWVRVRDQDEILATLDGQGCVDGMPFMPEMLRFCGQRMRVAAVAHKTCDTARKTGGRRLSATVHLENTRCDGSAHGGCQAECYLFWKDAWLKPDRDTSSAPPSKSSFTLEHLHATTKQPADASRFSCQTTCLFDATQPLRWWDVRQYLYDVRTRNHSLGHVLSMLTLASLRRLQRAMPFGYRVIRMFVNTAHRILTGRNNPDFEGKIAKGQRTPTGRLGLQPGDRVRVKSVATIVESIDTDGKNRGLSFDPEMATFCEQDHVVHQRVTQILDENTGAMVPMKEPCITLKGVVCRAEYSACRLMCPRAIPSYWREIWLEPTDGKDR